MNYFKSSQYKKTKPWIITLFLLFFVIGYYVIIWVLFGEFNVLKFNWVLGEGVIFNKDMMVNERNFNPLIFAFIIPPLLVYFLLILFIKYTFKQTGYDLIPLTYSLSVAMITTILSGLFDFSNTGLIIFARIILVLTVFFISFFILVYLTNKILISFDFKNDYVYVNDLLTENNQKTERKKMIHKLKPNKEETITISDYNK
ncbi:MPN565 family protein [Mycoplasma sp. E35C]|uniref:MPN565 family protein n=1 Tax=Mycoplasma sp. E35C TaxID=2801918 RepID=UPI001CA46CE0|nr:hypothetical protein [Mycoplasma sp. E35C]QZX48821.1 hypothetical protein JJE79_02050 [Mycoplasma sp. E35C]